MKSISILIFFFWFVSNSWALKISDSKNFKFEVLFTNPICATYKYDRPMITHSGKNIDSKPINVYCKPSDEAASVSRTNSPQYRLIEWIESPETKEIYSAYLSFSAKNISNAMCRALKRGVKINMVLDRGSKTEVSVNRTAESLKKCGDIVVTYRGSSGGLGYAHNKILMVNPNSKNVSKIVFSSGNLTGGTSINHENWNFVTVDSSSYFAQTHRCVILSMIEAGDKKTNFKNHLNECRSQIQALPESDIKVFFSPIDGKDAYSHVEEASHNAAEILGISHRFSGIIAELFVGLVGQKKNIKFILDDDIYWSEKLKKNIGRNTKYEAFKIYNELITKGMSTRFLQTNQNVYQLQHNKFFVFNFTNGDGAVFNGAGNMTTAAFTKNFENFYYITIPEVVDAYRKQYSLYFNKMATESEDMPRDYILP